MICYCPRVKLEVVEVLESLTLILSLAGCRGCFLDYTFCSDSPVILENSKGVPVVYVVVWVGQAVLYKPVRNDQSCYDDDVATLA